MSAEVLFPDWTYRPHHGTGLPGLPARQAGPRPPPRVTDPAPGPVSPGATVVAVNTQAPAPAACDCGAKLDALLEVLSLPGGLRGLVLALAAAPDADALDVLADYLEERTDPRAGRFRGLARRARGKGGAG